MDKIDKVLAWLVMSSKNARQISLTVKGVLGAVSTSVLLVFGVLHFGMPPIDEINTVIDYIVLAVNATLTAITYVAAAVSAWAVAWGALRKLITSVNGTNAVLNHFNQ